MEGRRKNDKRTDIDAAHTNQMFGSLRIREVSHIQDIGDARDGEGYARYAKVHTIFILYFSE
jgi:hypothetical protein